MAQFSTFEHSHSPLLFCKNVNAPKVALCRQAAKLFTGTGLENRCASPHPVGLYVSLFVTFWLLLANKLCNYPKPNGLAAPELPSLEKYFGESFRNCC